MEVKEGYKKTEIGVIPEDWEVEFVDNISDVKSGKRLPLGNYLMDTKTNYPYIRVADMFQGGVSLANIRYVPPNVYPTIKNYRIFKEDIFISVAGTLGIVGVIPNELDGANLTENADRLTSIKCDRDFLLYVFLSDLIQKRIEEERTLGAQPKLALTRIRKFQIPLPPTKEEQKAIAEVLSDTDNLIQALEKRIAKKRLIKQGAMQKLLTPKDGWKVKKLGEIAEIVGGGTPNTFIKKYWNGRIQWFTPTEIGINKYVVKSIRKITVEGLKNSSARILPVGTVLLTSRAGIGDLSILKEGGCTNQGFQSLIAKKLITNEFLYYLMITLKNVLIQNASGSTFLEISPNRIKQIDVSIPNCKKQSHIASILSDMDTEIETLEKKLAKYKQLKQGLMQNLLTGKIRLV
ncbi:MAG: restriction endonuclease subunit S [Deltaproteobacteria bacterium]|jgi:type I restriction enzyme S subunit|nr:restriction endonuclease subunit S [Deltaproteobacteria bacterium]